jgi:uncharacterized membrane protein YfcA
MTTFHWPTLIAMASVATLGAVLGKKLSQRLPERIYFFVIQTLLFVVSVYLVGKALGQMI